MQPLDVFLTASGLRRVASLWLAPLGGLALFGAVPAFAWQYQAIHSFTGSPGDGASPLGGVVKDSQGRLYGTTYSGGLYDDGTVFRLTPPVSGHAAWTEEILHNFTGPEGASPMGAIVLGSDGSVYGATQGGGPYGGPKGFRGVVFKLANTAGWPATVLHAFTLTESGYPNTGVIFGPGGLLYGTTPSFLSTGKPEIANLGSAYSVSILGDTLEYEILHTFYKGGDDYGVAGITPAPPQYYNGLAGSAHFGGDSGLGTVFALKLESNGSAAESYLYSFGPQPDVSFPEAPPLAGQAALRGGFFGCAGGGGLGSGGIYSLTPNGKGSLAESVLYTFGSQANDPNPGSGALQCYLTQGDSAGVLYGTSDGGGQYSNGAFFEIDPPNTSGGAWTEKTDYSFGMKDLSAWDPVGMLLRDGPNYYGAAEISTNGTSGAIYELTP